MRLQSSRALRVRVVAVTAALGAAVVLVGLTPAASQAVARTQSGARCTIVGTAGSNVINGTARNDVICGLGGNDRINGRGGNDIVDGGAGNDSIAGSTGNDTLVGGPGRDTLDGGAGGDRVDGGPDNDVLRGSDGNDLISGGAGDERISAGTGNDRVSGGDGKDVITGEAGNDVVSGGAGADNLQGGSGSDRIYGGDGADREVGEDGNDTVSGDLGDDDLNGGAGVDAVDGGAGFNVCDVVTSPGDRQVRCAVDNARPVIGTVSAAQPTVDVSSADQQVKVLAHITDDTGVKRVEYGYGGFLVSGTPRDGVWAAYVNVPHGAAPGPRTVYIQVYDRVGRITDDTRSAGYTVVGSAADTQMPVITSVNLDSASYDVRTAARAVTTTVQMSDDLAGASSVYVCLAHAFPSGEPSFRQAGACEQMSMVSGSARNATWRASSTIARGAVGGTWNVEIRVADGSGNSSVEDRWFGPDGFASATEGYSSPQYRAIPHGAGAFTVLGSDPDTHPPSLGSVRLSTSQVDTRTGAVEVTADIVAADVEGISDVGLTIDGYPGSTTTPDYNDRITLVSGLRITRVSGSAQNGVWRATFTIAGGTPDGTYAIGVFLQDSAHLESWVAENSGTSDGNHLLTDALAPTGTHFVVANSP